MSGRACLLIVALWAGALTVRCDDFQPAFAVGSDGQGGPAVYPVSCSPDDRVVELRVEDTGASDQYKISKTGGQLLWHVRSLSGYPGDVGTSPETVTAADTVVPWVDPLRALPPGRYLRFTISLRIDGKIHDFQDELRVSEIELRPGAVSARFYGVIPLDEFQNDVVPRACHVDNGLIGEWLEHQPHWLQSAVSISSLFWLPALGGLLWGSIVVARRLRRRWLSHSG